MLSIFFQGNVGKMLSIKEMDLLEAGGGGGEAGGGGGGGGRVASQIASNVTNATASAAAVLASSITKPRGGESCIKSLPQSSNLDALAMQGT